MKSISESGFPPVFVDLASANGRGDGRGAGAMALPATAFADAAERGVSILELALILPIVLLLIIGLVDYGTALHEIQLISAAGREGARAGTSHPRVVQNSNPAVLCVDPNRPLATIDCGRTDQTSLSAIPPSEAVVNVAKKAACASLNGAGSSGSKWNVSADVRCVREDGATFQMLHVVIEQAPGTKSCIFCLQDRLAALHPRAESTFLMELDCVPAC